MSVLETFVPYLCFPSWSHVWSWVAPKWWRAMKRKGCSDKSEPQGISCLLGVSKALSERWGEPAGCAKMGAKSGTKLCPKCFISGAQHFAQNLVRKIYNTPKELHKFPACLVPKIKRPFSKVLSWFLPPAHHGLSCHGLSLCFSSSWVATNLTENHDQECNKATT